MAVKSKSNGKVEKTNFGKKKDGKAKRHVNKHNKTKSSNQTYRGQGR
jgi:hypothetical protein